MTELIEAIADLLRGGIVIEKDGDNAVRIRLESEKPAATEAEGTGPASQLSW